MSSSVHGFKLKRKRYDITATATATITTGTCMGTHACTHACKHTSFSLITPHFHNTVELETTEMTETEIAATRATTTVIAMITGGKRRRKKKTTTTTTTTTTTKTKNGYMNFVQSVSYSFTPPAPTTANESYIQ